MRSQLLLPTLSLLMATMLAAQPVSDAAAPAPAPTDPAPAASAPPAEPTPAEATPDAEAPGELLGSIADGRYHSPSGAFDVAIPMLAGDNPLIFDNPEIVVFKDDVQTLLTIAAFAMPPLAKWEFETTSAREFLIKFFRDYVLDDYLEAFPGTTVQSARLIGDLEGGALMVNTLHPGGSAFALDPIVRNLPDTPAPVAKRGNLLFCHGDHIFVVSTELAGRVTEASTYSTDTETEDRILRDRLIDIYSQMNLIAMPAK